MTPATIDRILALLAPDKIRDAFWMIGVFVRWNMPAEEADEWRRRILARQRFFELNGNTTADA